MNRHGVLFILCFFLLSFARVNADDNPFQRLSEKSEGQDLETVTAAQQMLSWFSGSSSEADGDDARSADAIPNPFVSRVPRKGEAAFQEDDISRRDLDDEGVLPEGAIPDEMPDFRLSGLVWDTPRPQAILGDMIVNIGDQVSGWTVVEISNNGIVIESEGKTRDLIEPQRSVYESE